MRIATLRSNPLNSMSVIQVRQCSHNLNPETLGGICARAVLVLPWLHHLLSAMVPQVCTLTTQD